MLVERVCGYDNEGHPRETLFVDGAEVPQVVCYELHPDDPVIGYGLGWVWAERQYDRAAAASPAAAELIRRWAYQTVEHGGVINPDDKHSLAEAYDEPAADRR